MPKQRSPLVFIYLTIFIDLIGIGILIPVIPQLLGNPASPEYLLPAGTSIGTGYFLLGILTASYPIAQFFATPILGQLSDKKGRRAILLFSLFGTAIGYLLFAYAVMERNIPLLFVSRILDGITGGNISVAQAVIADVTPPEKRARSFGLMGAVFGIGFILGPYIGGQLADPHLISWFNAATPFWFAAILAFVNMALLWIFLPETRSPLSRKPIDWAQSIHHIVKAFTGPLKLFFLVGFLYWGGFSFFVTFFGVFLIERFGFSASNIGNFFAYVGIWIALVQGLLTPFVGKRASELNILRVTMFGTGVALLLFLLPGPWMILLGIVPIFSTFNGLTQANYMGYLSRSVSADVQGEILGINASVSALAQALPPMLSGVIAAQSTPSMTIVIAFVVVTIAGLIFALKFQKNRAV